MKTIPDRCRDLPGLTRKQVPSIAHDAQQLEDSIAARVRHYFEARTNLEASLRRQYPLEALWRVGVGKRPNPRATLTALLEHWDKGDHEFAPALYRGLIVELMDTLEPLFAQLPEPGKDC